MTNTEGDKLAKMVLMLSSLQDGEVVSAARAIDRWLRARHLDWHDLANKLRPDQPAAEYGAPTMAQPAGGDWTVMTLEEIAKLTWLDKHKRALRPNERMFVASMIDRVDRWDKRTRWSPKQRDWAMGLWERENGVAPAGGPWKDVT